MGRVRALDGVRVKLRVSREKPKVKLKESADLLIVAPHAPERQGSVCICSVRDPVHAHAVTTIAASLDRDTVTKPFHLHSTLYFLCLSAARPLSRCRRPSRVITVPVSAHGVAALDAVWRYRPPMQHHDKCDSEDAVSCSAPHPRGAVSLPADAPSAALLIFAATPRYRLPITGSAT